MQTTIQITGQISGNTRLLTAIATIDSTTSKEMFYGYNITFPTRKQAYRALWQGYKHLRSDKQDAANSMLSYCRKSSIRYDASKATIIIN